MLQKLILTRADKYQLIIATSYMADMLVNFIQGREHYLELGCERGNIPIWDDVVLIDSQEIRRHIQVKRQTKHFCTKAIERPPKTGENQKNELQDRSTLDKTMLSLAEWVKNNNDDAINKKRKFIIELPSGDIRIKTVYEINKTKTYFTVRNFQDICNEFNDNTCTRLLEKKKRHCKNTKNFYTWLKTWCGFDDWSHIKKAMLLLKITESGKENDINQRIEDKLSTCFQDEKATRKKIQGYIDKNTTYTSSIKPRALLQELKGDLRSDIATWTQYRNTSSQEWSIIGTHDTRSSKTIEKPSQVVKKLWNKKGSSRLKVVANAPDGLDDPLPQSIVHLALHLPVLSIAFFDDLSAWKREVKNSIYTLGCDESDLDDEQLPWNSNSDKLASSGEDYTLCNSDEKDQQADALNKKMSQHTWDAVCEKVEEKNSKLGKTELRRFVERRWGKWKQYLDKSNIERNKLLEQMLHPVSEGEDIIGSLRVGLRTANILADGFKMLLIVSVALNRDDDQWNSSIGILALEYWSGLAGKKRQVNYLSDMANEILGRESASILLLSKVTDSPNEIYEDTMATDSASQHNLNVKHQPNLLVTNTRRFRQLVQAGNINDIKKYLEKQRRFDLSSQEASVQRAARV